MIDSGLLGRLAALTMEHIEASYSDGFTLRTVAIVVEVDAPTHSEIVIRSTEDRPWTLEAFLFEAMNSIAQGRQTSVEEE